MRQFHVLERQRDFGIKARERYLSKFMLERDQIECQEDKTTVLQRHMQYLSTVLHLI
jgi:hypothetical protein